jgi:hypothetical protein
VECIEYRKQFAVAAIHLRLYPQVFAGLEPGKIKKVAGNPSPIE